MTLEISLFEVLSFYHFRLCTPYLYSILPQYLNSKCVMKIVNSMKERVTISLSKSLYDRIELERGIANRSAYIEGVIRIYLQKIEGR